MPWLGLSILLVLVLILGAFVAYFFFDVGKDDETGSPAEVAGVETGATGQAVVAGDRKSTRLNSSH